jgi:hypothetical protein
VADGRIFLGIATLICIGAFLIGLRFSRMSEEKILDSRTHVEMPAFLVRGRSHVEQVHLFGRMMMIAALLFLLFFAALSFGIFGPVEGIQTIK